ncbi:hypothetical protein [Arenimonas sp.]|uniref:hypothetical protein n=1 Tax=Arenimonas sp. TaxID=1872635 RepID=UPI002600B9BF|nr:hypothetical protein [Arenimonas sp.]
MRNFKLLAALPLLLLSGCVVLPTYVAKPDEPMATVQGLNFPSPAFCADGVGYQAKPDKEGRFQVPAGSRVSLYSSVQLYDYQVTYSCYPGASAVFAPKGSYFASVVLSSTGCRVDLVRADDATDTGLAPEPTNNVPICNPWAKTSKKPKETKAP